MKNAAINEHFAKSQSRYNTFPAVNEVGVEYSLFDNTAVYQQNTVQFISSPSGGQNANLSSVSFLEADASGYSSVSCSSSVSSTEHFLSVKSPHHNVLAYPPNSLDPPYTTSRLSSTTTRMSFEPSANGPHIPVCHTQIARPDPSTDMSYVSGVPSDRALYHPNHCHSTSPDNYQFPTATQSVTQPDFPYRHTPISYAHTASAPSPSSNIYLANEPLPAGSSAVSQPAFSPGTFTGATTNPYPNPGCYPVSYSSQRTLGSSSGCQAPLAQVSNFSAVPVCQCSSTHASSAGTFVGNSFAIPPVSTVSSHSPASQPFAEWNGANPAFAHTKGSSPVMHDQDFPSKFPPPPSHQLTRCISPHSSSTLPTAPPGPSIHSKSVHPTAHDVQPMSVHPSTPISRQPPGYRRQLPSDTPTVFRSPGTPATLSEWSCLKTPIGLLQEQHLLPSDAADLPPKPAVSFPVNCDPDVMRCTLTGFPATAKLLALCRLPLGLIMHPFRDLSRLHTINSTVIVRCRSCRTYINPFVQFVDSGRRWRCPICFLSNTVPDDFFYDPGTQTYGDPARRPEIRSATVEFIAPPEYMLRPPQPATYLFCFDVSRNAIATGYLRVVCDTLATHLLRMPGDSRRQIALITYDSTIHFYKLCGDSIKLLICPDLDEPFIPEYEGLLNLITESSDALVDILSRLPDSFAQSNDVGNCLGSVLQVALKLIGSTGGRITVFNTCLPNMGAGCLRMREDQSDRTTADVKNLGPEIDFYKTFALDCAAQQVAVDLFLLNSQYCDIATLSGASRFSSGSVYHYPDFYCPSASASSTMQSVTEPRNAHNAANLMTDQSNTQLLKASITLECFRRDFDRYLSRKIGFEAVMRIRCTHGLSIQAFHGSFFVRSTDLMSLPNVNPDAGFAVQLGISESVEKLSAVCCQAAILYTSSKGDRRIRVHTLCLPVVHTPSEVFLGADQGAIACLIGKMAVDRAINTSLLNAREALANAVADFLSAYASAIGITSDVSISSYYMACPPNLRLLPLYVCGLLRHIAFRIGVPVRIDDRSAALERLKSAPPEEMLTLIYPRLYAVHQFASKPITSATSLVQKAATLCLSDYGDSRIDANHPSADSDSSCSTICDTLCDAVQLPCQLHLSARSISRSGVYLLDTGEIIILLVGSQNDSASGAAASAEMLRQLFDVSNHTDLPLYNGLFSLPPTDDKADVPAGLRRLSALINLLRQRRPHSNALVCIRHDAPAPLRTLLLSTLVEDRTEFAPSYHEFLQMVQSIMKS